MNFVDAVSGASRWLQPVNNYSRLSHPNQ